MNCWLTLGIAPTTNKIIIKKAYAVTLKFHKPDEDPAGFVALHAFYKEALQHCTTSSHPFSEVNADIKTEQSIENSAQTNSNFRPFNDHISKQTEVIDEFEDIDYRKLNIKFECAKLSTQVSQALDNPTSANKQHSWDFLETNEALYDIEFKVYASNYIFEHLLALKKAFPTNKLPISKTLDIFFRWSDKRDVLEKKFGYEAVFKLLGKHELSRKVSNLRGRRLNTFHAAWRNLCYLLSVAAFKIAVRINIFAKNGKLLHDRFSR